MSPCNLDDAVPVDCVVAGAGVVGLAVARALALAGREVLVLEALDLIGSETSARNSEVIHAGIYYRPGSLKARLCVSGRDALYAYCAERGIGHRRCGKLIVANGEAEVARLDVIRTQAAACGVANLEELDRVALARLEPALHADAALLSPSTGIIDSHGLMLALQGDLENAGGTVAFHAPVLGGAVTEAGLRLDVGGPEPMTLLATSFINAAGHGAVAIAKTLSGLDSSHVPDAYLCKGSYYALPGRAPFTRLIYPVPEAAGLGVHLTLDLGGQARFGPDTEWIGHVDYDVDPARAERFYDAIRHYWPGLPDGVLTPAYSGIRPKITPPGAPAADFRIDGPAEHGVAGLVNLFGIESPGLTACLAIADLVVERLAGEPAQP